MTDADKLTKQIETYVSQLREVGWCVIEGVLPANEVNAIRQHVETAHLKAMEEYETAGGSLTHQRDRDGGPGKNVIAFIQPLAPYLAEKRVLGVIRAVLDPHVRIAQTEFKPRPPNDDNKMYRSYHSDWPHDLVDRDRAGAVRQPFPNVTMGLTTIWLLSPFGPESGGTWVVPGSHRDPRNPRGLEDGIDEFKPIPGEMQASGTAGSVLIIDSRIWHSNAANPSDEPRVAIVVRYVPWWVSVEFGGRNNAIVPRQVYEAFPEDVKPLYRHRVDGVTNSIS
jgi:hypothetical protein